MFDLFIATPERQIFDGKVASVTIPSTTGVITVLYGHEPLLTTIEAGELVVVDEKGDSHFFAAFLGVAHIEKRTEGAGYISRVSVLLQNTENVNEIDEANAQEALERAKTANLEKDTDGGLGTNTLLLKELNRVRIARKHKAKL